MNRPWFLSQRGPVCSPQSQRFPRLIIVMTVVGMWTTSCTTSLLTEHRAPPSTVTTTSQSLTFTNPVYRDDLPDPFVLRHDDTYYAFSSNVGAVNVMALRSTNLTRWTWVADALPNLPAWAVRGQGLTWAPGVLQRDDVFVLYFAAGHVETGLQCISYGISDRPEGPYVDESTEPLICQKGAGCDDVIGSIDPYPFIDDSGTAYLLWMGAGDTCAYPLVIWAQQLSDDGLSLVGQPSELVRSDQSWEAGVVENPAMWKHDGMYYLFYSGNEFLSRDYAVGYAVCETPLGPCTKPSQQPILAQSGSVMGPGGQAFFTDDQGNLWLAYHAWTAPDVGYPEGKRTLRIDRVTFEGRKPLIYGPTCDRQTLP